MRLFLLINTLSGAAIGLLACAGYIADAGAQSRDARGLLDFQGRYLVSVSDADMLASAYVDGRLGPEGRDALSVIRLDGDPRDWAANEIPISNSVASPPAVVDLTPDGRFAFVTETFGPRPDSVADEDATFRDLSFGDKLQVIDLADPANPRLAQTVTVPQRPDAVRVNADGTLVAVTFHPAGGGQQTPLALFRFADSRLGEPVFPAIPDWDVSQRLIDIDWHPQQNVLALLNASGPDIRFANVSAELAIEPFGNVVQIEKEPYRIVFTPDGRHVLANPLYWGPDVAGRWIEAPRGSLLSVRMNADTGGDGDDDEPRHALVSRIITGVSPEGIAVSPDGRWVVTTNLERSYLPYDDGRITWYSSLTLARLDPDTGALTRVGEFNYDGILPEAAVWDNSSRFLAVVNYDHFDDRRRGSSVDFWRLVNDPLEPNTVQLVKTEHSVAVTRGAHSIELAR